MRSKCLTPNTVLGTAPPRKLDGGQFGKHITYFPSRKNNNLVACESNLEADFCLYLEYLPSFRHYISHPIQLILSSGGRTPLKYTPDFYALIGDGEYTFYEIKPDILMIDEKTREKMQAIIRILAKEGYPLELIGESSFRNPAITSNLNYLYGASFGSTTSGVFRVVQLIEESSQKKLTARQLLDTPFPPSAADIAAAIFSQKVHIDLNRFFSIDSVISSKSKNARCI